MGYPESSGATWLLLTSFYPSSAIQCHVYFVVVVVHLQRYLNLLLSGMASVGWSRRLGLLVIATYSLVQAATDVTELGKPISIPPSQYW